MSRRKKLAPCDKRDCISYEKMVHTLDTRKLFSEQYVMHTLFGTKPPCTICIHFKKRDFYLRKVD